MIKRKSSGEHGKIRLSKYFQEFKEGERVAVIREHTLRPKFPKQIQGRTGVIKGMRGNSYIIRMNDLNKEKTYIIHPIHLKKIQ